jgi:hypothetical protein
MRTSLAVQRSAVQRLLASSGLPPMSEEDAATDANLNQVNSPPPSPPPVIRQDKSNIILPTCVRACRSSMSGRRMLGQTQVIFYLALLFVAAIVTDS